MKKKLLLAVSVAVIAAILAFAGYVFVWGNPFGWFVVTTDAFTREGWASIKKGQTSAEVEDVLGKPFNIVECSQEAQCATCACRRSQGILHGEMNIWFMVCRDMV